MRSSNPNKISLGENDTFGAAIDPPFKDIYSNYTLGPYIAPTFCHVGADPATAAPGFVGGVE
ncbi:tail fiber protein [Escherichia phage SF]|uniref:Tail fiber protein n=1 Tax=Escherichia phage SF TaxID=2234080 RepID=A0A2Z4QCQ0_9CAUD|nr:tail fiber protein [Escherichia phage SF]AWY08015.1 tail fiber protein [Escherichia phage SF]